MKPPRRIDEHHQPLNRFRNELDGMFQRFFDDPFFSNLPFGNNHITPACNIVEKKDRYTIEVEIPGIDPDQIHIDLDGHHLTIKGERHHQEENEDKEKQMHTMEHRYGSFFRSFRLPDGIDEKAINAHDEHGVLYIEIPKSKENTTRRITIDRQH